MCFESSTSTGCLLGCAESDDLKEIYDEILKSQNFRDKVLSSL